MSGNVDRPLSFVISIIKELNALVIYGVAILAVCMLIGVVLGDYLGILMGVNANVGGVGIAMLFLVLLIDHLKKKGMLNPKSEQGMAFWSAMYIPIVVAMTAQQNVVGAIEGGPLAILAGISATLVSFALVPLLSRIGKDKYDSLKQEEEFKKAN